MAIVCEPQKNLSRTDYRGQNSPHYFRVKIYKLRQQVKDEMRQEQFKIKIKNFLTYLCCPYSLKDFFN